MYNFNSPADNCYFLTRQHEQVSSTGSALTTNAWFPAFRIRCRSRFRKNRVRTGRLCRGCWGVCAAVALQTQEPGRRVSHAKEILYERMNGNGELTETENVIFLRKLRSSYIIFTDERNSCVLCYGNGYTATVTATDTECWKSGITQMMQGYVWLTESASTLWAKKWKNFENRLTFREVIDISRVSILTHSV